ncbi:MAG TPA: malto-oligosyltrehalose trehalohydrolase [Chthoniobacterales bacterium]|nr:malto-oligosyltrehalose trehalohydrolase [Chthoniobacterales bacterium]
MAVTTKRRFPIGAELVSDNEAHFRVWAPKARQLEVAIETGNAKGDVTFHPLEAETDGYFSGLVEAQVGTRYRFRLNGSGDLYPDPASRYQPQGPHQASCVVDPSVFQWHDRNWRGRDLKGQIIYEFHTGTFTREGTWRAAAEQLPALARDGITVLEMMPIADFPGRFGWGYDGVNMFAPAHRYGTPDDLRFFIDRAHSENLSVILDVVYNHFGPDGNYLRVFSDDYFTNRYENDWGDSINFDGPKCAPVREFFVTNARYWLEEYHFDGFRFDATQDINDSSEQYILAEIAQEARETAGEKSIILVAENEPQETKIVKPPTEGGYDLDGLWNDDFHHSALVGLTGRAEAYYTDYRGAPQEFISAAKYGYLYQGQPYMWQEAPRGTPAFGISPEAFICFIENHDQVSNTATGDRLRFQTSPGRYRAMTALLLLGPWTPMLFQGEEFGSSSPFIYFTDVGDENLQEAIRKGRFGFLAQFPSIAHEETQKRLADPFDEEMVARCCLDFSEREKNHELYVLHLDLIRLRREDSRFREQIPGGVDGAVLNQESFVLRYFGKNNDDRLLVVNLGRQQRLEPAPEPLLAPSIGFEWERVWSSELRKYGGPGEVAVVTQESWILPAEATVALRLVPAKAPRKKPKRRRVNG